MPLEDGHSNKLLGSPLSAGSCRIGGLVAAADAASDETIRDMAGHVSKPMLKHYSHIGMEAKRRAVQALVSKKAVAATGETEAATPEAEMTQIPVSVAKESTKVVHSN